MAPILVDYFPDSAEHLLLQRQLRWLGHVIRMPSNRLPRRLLYGELLTVFEQHLACK